MTDTYVKLNNILLELATTAASGCAYKSWSDDFARKECREVWSDENAPLRRKRGVTFTRSEIVAMNQDELNALGFHRWDDSGLRLIPLWAFNYIADGETLRDINGDYAVKGQDKINLDHRLGATAYGFTP